jgi:hypothetical protein
MHPVKLSNIYYRFTVKIMPGRQRLVIYPIRYANVGTGHPDQGPDRPVSGGGGMVFGDLSIQCRHFAVCSYT